MAQQKRTGRLVVFIIFLFMGIGATAFATGVVDLSFFSTRPVWGAQLSDMVSFRGAVKLDDLRLSRSEIRKINHATMVNRTVFDRVQLTLNMADRYAPVQVDKNTKLTVGLKLDAGDGCEVKSWDKDILRKNLVPYMVRYMKRAARELVHYRKHPEVKNGVARLYI